MVRLDQSDVTLTEVDVDPNPHATAEDLDKEEDGDEPVIVIFRRWRRKSEGQGVIALFPTVAADYGAMLCQSYEHIGQHGGANFDLVIGVTRPVRYDDPDVIDLKAELERIGWKLIPRQRWYRGRESRNRPMPVPSLAEGGPWAPRSYQ